MPQTNHPLFCLYWYTAPNPCQQAIFEVGECPHLGNDSSCRAVPRTGEISDDESVVIDAADIINVCVSARLRHSLVLLV